MVEAVFGATAGRIILIDVVIAIIVCTLACQTSGARMMYSMARQKALPFHGVLAKVSPRTGTPIVTSLVVGVGAALALVVNLGQSAVFTALSSLCIAMLYLGYLGVTAPLLLHRFRHARGHASAATAEGTDEHGKRLFSLGQWAIPVTVVAVIYQVLAIINLAWPRSSRLRPDRAHLVAAVERRAVHRHHARRRRTSFTSGCAAARCTSRTPGTTTPAPSRQPCSPSRKAPEPPPGRKHSTRHGHRSLGARDRHGRPGPRRRAGPGRQGRRRDALPAREQHAVPAARCGARRAYLGGDRRGGQLHP